MDTLERVRVDVEFISRELLTDDDNDLWSSRAKENFQKYYINGNIDFSKIRNFRRDNIFINESPTDEPGIKSYVSGWRRGQFEHMRHVLKAM